MTEEAIRQRLDAHSASIAKKVDRDVFQLTVGNLAQKHDDDVTALKEDFNDLRASYRKLVAVAVTEAFGLLIAIVLIAVQLALSFGATNAT